MPTKIIKVKATSKKKAHTRKIETSSPIGKLHYPKTKGVELSPEKHTKITNEASDHDEFGIKKHLKQHGVSLQSGTHRNSSSGQRSVLGTFKGSHKDAHTSIGSTLKNLGYKRKGNSYSHSNGNSMEITKHKTGKVFVKGVVKQRNYTHKQVLGSKYD